MKGFGFSLAAHTSLREGPDGYSLVSALPVRVLRLNRPLFLLLKHIRDGGGLSAFLNENPEFNENKVLQTLLTLAAKGYLRLETIAEIERFPLVSIIIPVRDQPGDLGECLHSLSEIDYPEDRLEIIVVDDGSKKDVSEIITSESIKFIREDKSLGPATARNLGATYASGDILAFLDADCIAGQDWLRELVPFFNAADVGAVGGYVEGYYRRSSLDRYEAVASSLNLGRGILIEGDSSSSFYVPTANLLVVREAFRAAGGFRAGMRVGEDVDFCWRLRGLGWYLLYVPSGSIAHKHRNRLGRMMKRRAEYGASEAPLYRAHPDKRKIMPAPVFSGLAFLALALSIVLVNPYPLCALPLLFGLDLWRRSAKINRLEIGLSFLRSLSAAFRSYLSFFYFAFFHLVRYYLVLFIGFGLLWYPLWIFSALALVYASIVDYYVKKPGLLYPVFLFYYLLEHLAYQAGVFWGCMKKGYFGSYLVSFRRARP
jgi:mycofactocin system glycosyltransferase